MLLVTGEHTISRAPTAVPERPLSRVAAWGQEFVQSADAVVLLVHIHLEHVVEWNVLCFVHGQEPKLCSSA